MMYRCEMCGKLSQPGEPELRYVERRAPKPGQALGEIRKEYRVCGRCQRLLVNGMPVGVLQAKREEMEPEFTPPLFEGGMS